MKLKLNVSHVLLLILLIMIAYVILSRMNCSCDLIEGGDYGLDAAGMSLENPDQLLDPEPGREVPGPGSVSITERELRDIENEIEYRKAAGFMENPDQLLDTIPGREVPGPGPGSVSITEKELRDIENEIEYRKAAGFNPDQLLEKVHY